MAYFLWKPLGSTLGIAAVYKYNPKLKGEQFPLYILKYNMTSDVPQT